ncbi:MAG: 30S ribosome-binding factor RbfA [Sulfurovum sp.]|nr:30S ribosome-binding factor RbfA [Sulfurovum sp.]
MTPTEIKRKRTESILKDLLPEALGTLDDNRISHLNVIEVVCSRGRYDARVYLDPIGLDDKEQGEALKQLRKVSPHLKNYIRDSEGWYKAPNFVFEFDTHLEHITKMDALFDQIASKKNSEQKDES